jgi:hypothetical protein
VTVVVLWVSSADSELDTIVSGLLFAASCVKIASRKAAVVETAAATHIPISDISFVPEPGHVNLVADLTLAPGLLSPSPYLALGEVVTNPFGIYAPAFKELTKDAAGRRGCRRPSSNGSCCLLFSLQVVKIGLLPPKHRPKFLN